VNVSDKILPKARIRPEEHLLPQWTTKGYDTQVHLQQRSQVMATDRLYYPEEECEVTASDLYDTEVVGVLDETENRHFLRVARGPVPTWGGGRSKPASFVHILAPIS
jgi:hypothetical protein